jgi:hypothetical protein
MSDGLLAINFSLEMSLTIVEVLGMELPAEVLGIGLGGDLDVLGIGIVVEVLGRGLGGG